MSQEEKFILCIDDDEDDTIWIEEAISEIDPRLDVVIRNNGKEAMEFLFRIKEYNHLPCLILLDINMPHMNGRETITIIKKDNQLKNIPIVVFTTSSSQSDQQYFEKHGAHFISKPSEYKEMKLKIQQAVLKCA